MNVIKVSSVIPQSRASLNYQLREAQLIPNTLNV